MHPSLSALVGLTLIACAAPLSRTLPSGTPSPKIQPQHEQVLQPGMRIRAAVGSSIPYSVIGTVVEVRSDSIVLQPADPGPSYVVLKSRLSEIQVSHGMSTLEGDGAGMGAFGGVGIGFALAYASPYTFWSTLSRSDKGAMGGLLGGVAGLVLGMAIGSSLHVENWETIPLERLAIITPGGHAGVWGIKLSFAR